MCMKEAAGRYLLFFCSASNCVPALYEPLAGAVLPVNREAVSLASQRKPSQRHISGQTHHLGGSSLSERCFKPAFWLGPSRADRCSSVNALRSVFFA
ncbi:Ribosomal RNA large subunit methyltransferase [Trichinella spiralis]